MRLTQPVAPPACATGYVQAMVFSCLSLKDPALLKELGQELKEDLKNMQESKEASLPAVEEDHRKLSMDDLIKTALSAQTSQPPAAA